MKVQLTVAQLVEAMEVLDGAGQEERDAVAAGLGACLAGLDDDLQAQVLCRADRALREHADAARERGAALVLGAEWQWEEVGSHLVECSCSTSGGRQLVAGIWRGMLTEYLKQQPHLLPVTASAVREKVLVRLGVDDGEATLFDVTPEQARRMANLLRDAAERADQAAAEKSAG